MLSRPHLIALAVLSTALTTLVALPVQAQVADYILLDRCLSTSDEARPPRTFQWQLGMAFVSLQDAATGTGGWSGRHSYQYTAYAYLNGGNGYSEYGSGDDICLGPITGLSGASNYEVVSSAPDAAGGIHALADSPPGNYLGNRNLTATIDQTFDFSGLTDIRLVFFHHHALRWSSSGDRCYVEINTGSGWLMTDPENTPAGSFYSYYLGDKHQFKRGEVDLSAYAGQSNVQLRFRIQTSSSQNDDGWFIDDVRLLGDGATVFFDDFESGTGQWALQSPWGETLAGYSYNAGLGSVDQTGLYSVTPVATPVTSGEGMGFNVVHATYTDMSGTHHAYARVQHTGPQFVAPPDLGLEDLCQTTAVEDASAPIHERFLLGQNAPNPFNPSTQIAFKLEAEQRATLRIYDESGRLVRTLLDDAALAAGDHLLTWDGRNQRGELESSGVYLYKLTVGDQTLARKMVMVR